MGNVNTNSPMLIDQVVANAIEVYCGQGQGIVVVPFILSGAMGPVTTAASVAQAIAEALSCAFSQLVRPGAPFILGNFLSSMSLKTGAPTFGTPEPVMSNYAIGQIARHLGLPLRCGGGLTSSKVPDAQAAYESADSMHSTMLAGANFVLHSAGWMEGGLSMSFEKLVMDSDRNEGYAKFLGGMATDENAWPRVPTMKLNLRDISWDQATPWQTMKQRSLSRNPVTTNRSNNGKLKAAKPRMCVR